MSSPPSRPLSPPEAIVRVTHFGGKMMSTSRSLDVLEGDRSREWQSYRQLRNLECREETSGSGPIDYHNQFRNLQLRSPYQSRQRDNWRNQVITLRTGLRVLYRVGV